MWLGSAGWLLVRVPRTKAAGRYGPRPSGGRARQLEAAAGAGVEEDELEEPEEDLLSEDFDPPSEDDPFDEEPDDPFDEEVDEEEDDVRLSVR
ncbi:hypothetical protein ACWCOT_24635 [Nonomuraea bangladeshensis]